jgi:hypothetical protein
MPYKLNFWERLYIRIWLLLHRKKLRIKWGDKKVSDI